MSKVAKVLNASNDNIGKERRTGFFSGVVNMIKVSGMIRALHQLDDHTLENLGIRRAEIPAYASKVIDQDNKSAA